MLRQKGMASPLSAAEVAYQAIQLAIALLKRMPLRNNNNIDVNFEKVVNI